MAVGRQNETWNHTANLMALLATINGDPKSGRQYSPADFHPFADPPKIPEATPELLESLGFRRSEKPQEVTHGG